MTAPKPPGGTYWRAALFSPFTVNMPITVGMTANPWPNVDLPIELPIQLGMGTPSTFGVTMSLFVGMTGNPSGAASFAVPMSIQLGMSPYTPFAVSLSLQVGMQSLAVQTGAQINTTVQRSATI